MRRKRTEMRKILHISGIIAALLLLVLIALFVLVGRTRADGGVIQMEKTAGPFVITLFTTSAPLRAGPEDLSVMVQNAGTSEPVLDAQVQVQLRKENRQTVTSQATRDAAQNKLLYAAAMNIPEAGQWEIEVTVQRGEQAVRVSEAIAVAPPRSLLASHWQSLALPPLVILLFILNQWLKRRGHSLCTEER